ncbi:MAG TPA: TonB-dependent receptor [Rhizomicrobium sp.]|jgi:iron complex outermembrane receptor protein|nr:TonB-dependent receptor [Rhizomicrobium sp.]
MTLSRIFLAGCCAIPLLWAADASAQIETVIVTAQKRVEDVQKVPISIQAITAKTISDLGIKSSTDLSQFAPNVAIALPAGNGNQPIITIRGVGLNDYDTNNAGPNGVYIDEVYLSSPASQTFQAFDLDRIEILKGPQGTLYGRNTSGGAINFIAAKPTDELTGNLHGEYGAFGTYQLEGAIGGPIADGLNGRVSIVKNGSSGYTRNTFTGGLENGTNNIAGRAQLQWKPTEDLSFLLSVHGGSVANRPAEYRHLGALGGPACSDPKVVLAGTGGCTDLYGYGTPANFWGGAYNRQEHLQVHNYGTSLRGDYAMGEWSFVSLTAYEHSDKLHPEDTDASPNRLIEINFGVRSDVFTQELRANWVTDHNNMLLGAYYLNESLNQNQPLFILLDGDTFFGGPGTADGVAEIVTDQNHQDTASMALFGQDTFDITDALKITLGARYTGETKSFVWSGGTSFQSGGMDNFPPITPTLPPPGDTFTRHLANSSFNWRVAANYQIDDDVMAYASVSTGFKSGGFNGSFLNSNPDPVQVSAQLAPIKPEQVTAYEAGFKSNLMDDRLQLNASVFYNDYRDEQVFILLPLSPLLAVNILTNARKAHMMGADLEAIAKPTDELTLKAEIGLLQAKIDSDDSTPAGPGYHGHQLPLSPHVTASTLADYKLPIGEDTLDFQLSANFKSHQNFDIANSPFLTQRPYWLENARVGYSFDDDQWEVAGYVRNLTNQKYFIDIFDLSFLGYYQGIMGQPRTWGGEVNYHF